MFRYFEKSLLHLSFASGCFVQRPVLSPPFSSSSVCVFMPFHNSTRRVFPSRLDEFCNACTNCKVGRRLPYCRFYCCQGRGKNWKKKGIPNARWMLVCAWKIIINESRRALATDEKCDWIPFRLDRAFDSHRRYGLVVLIHRLGKFSYVICEDRLDGYRSGGVLCSTSPIIIFDLLFLITNRFRLGSSRSFFFFFFKKPTRKLVGAHPRC